MSRITPLLRHPIVLWTLMFLALVLLWLPAAGFPITSDTTNYYLLGQSFWRHGTYVLDGAPYAKHLPLHAILSYPLAVLLGPSLGMKTSTLLAGFAVLLGTFFLFRKSFSFPVALLAAIFVLFHHGFILMTMLGSADLLFTALFLFSLAAFDRAEKDTRWYLLAGLLAGLSILTRYNGLILFPLYAFFILWKRRSHLKSGSLWAGLVLACAVAGIWFTRNALVFGNPLHTEYGSEYGDHVPSLVGEVLKNLLYYGNSLHNILPVLLVLALWGLWREGRKQPLLVLGFLAGIAFGLLWWVKGIRFAFPGYPVLLGFSAIGAADAWKRLANARWIVPITIMFTVALHASVLCVYTYGQCNAWVDRTFRLFPPNLGLSSEGLYGYGRAKDFINAQAPAGSVVLVPGMNEPAWRSGFFRSDIRVVRSLTEACPAYEIVQAKPVTSPLFSTASAPPTFVVLR
ncbi:MAG: glycosyltransferase family 39 protein, partial [Candidatus Peribacteraceae bacterium]|nr:glycosyltransferase family 39 protein [Candidatus Peribacteraceae bacterium]